MHQNHVVGFLKHRLLGCIPSVFQSVSLGWGPRICISNRFPDVNVADELRVVFMFLKGCKKFKGRNMKQGLYMDFKSLQKMVAEPQTHDTQNEAFKGH